MRVINLPDVITVSSKPAISGKVSSPDSVGVFPCTICRYWGKKMIAPNIAAPTSSEAMPVITNVWLWNRCGGMIGSLERRSCQIAAASISSATATRPYVHDEFQSNSLPPRLSTSSKALTEATMNDAPSQSIECLRRGKGSLRTRSVTISAAIATGMIRPRRSTATTGAGQGTRR